jgi:hypothetical protein
VPELLVLPYFMVEKEMNLIRVEEEEEELSSQ